MLNRLWCNLYALFPQATSIQLMDQMRILYPVGRYFIPRFLLGFIYPKCRATQLKISYWIIKLHGVFKPKEVERNKTATFDATVPVLHDLHKVTWLNEPKSMRILCDVNLEVEIIQCNEQKSAGVQDNNWSFHIFKKMLSEHLFEKNFINKFSCRVTISYHAIPSIPCWQYVFPSVFFVEARYTTAAFQGHLVQHRHVEGEPGRWRRSPILGTISVGNAASNRGFSGDMLVFRNPIQWRKSWNSIV